MQLLESIQHGKHLLRVIAISLSLLLSTTSVKAQDVDEFVNSNLLWFFYHEMGHALIDIYQLPIFGQEEDASDVLSVLMINEFYEEKVARQIIYNAAVAFASFAELEGDSAYSDVHGPDMQRYYTMACLFIGGNYDEREELADVYQLPDDRLETCEEEFDLAFDSWGPVLEEATVDGGGKSLVYNAIPSDKPIEQSMVDLFSAEVEEMNKFFEFPETINVSVEDCGEANAFYDIEDREIIMCTEMAYFLGDL